MAWDIPNIIINLRKEIEESSGDVSDLETRVGTLESTVSPLPGRITAAEEEIDALQTDLDATPVTVTGTTIEIDNAAAIPAESLTMVVVPTQSGTGDPSPTNVRPITGISTATVQTTDGEATNVASMALGETVYGGSVDFNEGTGTSDWAEITPTEVNNVLYDSGLDIYYWLVVTNLSSINGANVMSDCFKSDNVVAIGNCYITSQGRHLIVIPVDQSLNTKVLANAWLEANTPQFVYKLATPTDLTLTADKLTLLEGDQTVTGNGGGDITLSYQKDNLIGDLKKWILANT